MQKLISIIITIFLIISCSKSHDNLDIDKVAKVISEYNKQGYFSGIAVIAKDNDIKFELINGLKNEQGDKIEIDSQFFIGSVTKQFTAASTLKALYEKFSKLHKDDEIIVKEVKNALNNPISVYLGVNNKIWDSKMPAWADKVTLHHLLSNSSGIPNYTTNKNYKVVNEEGLKFFQQEHSTTDIINLIKNEELLFEPGKGYDYSNTNFLLLTKVIENVSEMPYEKFLQEKIFNFLELKSTKNPTDSNLAKIKNRSEYRELVDQFKYDTIDSNTENSRYRTYTNVSLVQGTDSIISSARDLINWNLALHKNFTVIPKALHELMVINYAKDFDNIYGYGIIPTTLTNQTVYTHTGMLDGFHALVRYFKDDNISLIILTNISADLYSLENKINELENSLKATMPDAISRKAKAESIIREKYPDKRSFDILLQNIDRVLQ